MSKAIKLSKLPSGVAVLTVNQPDSKVNVLSTAMMTELNAALDQVTAMKPEALIIVSGKEDCFFAGANLEEVVPLQKGPSKKLFEVCEIGKALFNKIAALPMRTVAAVSGLCLGGGLELALACKFRVASDHPATKLGLPEVGLGFLPGWGGTVRMVRLLGIEAALRVINDPISWPDAKTAWKIGFVDEVVPAAELMKRAEVVALTGSVRRASKGFLKSLMTWGKEGNFIGRKFLRSGVLAQVRKFDRDGNYPAPLATTDLAFKIPFLSDADAFRLESMAFAELAVTDVSRNMVGLHFAEQESKRAPEGVKPTIDIKEVGILGAGVMGSGIGQAALYAGYKVVLFDINPDNLAKGVQKIKDLFGELVKKGKLTQEKVDGILANLKATTEYKDFANCDLIIEAIVDRLNIKIKAYGECEKVNSKRFIRGSNTSALSITEMAAASRDPGLVGGIHFFNPVHKMFLVEVIESPLTSPETTAALKAFALKLKKKLLTVQDGPGFAINRLLAPYMLEAMKLVEAGVPAADIDRAVQKFGMRMGPLELLDTVGFDISADVVGNMHKALGDRMAPPASIAGLAESKLLGKKGGKGFYVWGADEKRGALNQELLAKLSGGKKLTKQAGEIADRLMLVMVNEAARALSEKLVASPAQLDYGMCWGTGFPMYRGGPCRWADKLGAKTVVDKLTLLAQVAGANYEPCALLKEMAAKGQTFYKD